MIESHCSHWICWNFILDSQKIWHLRSTAFIFDNMWESSVTVSFYHSRTIMNEIILTSPCLKYMPNCFVKYITIECVTCASWHPKQNAKNNRFVNSTLVMRNTVADIGMKNEIPLGKSKKFYGNRLVLLLWFL